MDHAEEAPDSRQPPQISAASVDSAASVGAARSSSGFPRLPLGFLTFSQILGASLSDVHSLLRATHPRRPLGRSLGPTAGAPSAAPNA